MFKIGYIEREIFSYTQDDVIKFSEITGDNNPIHLDSEYAKYVKEFDLNRPNELTEILKDFIQNPQKYENSIIDGFKFYQNISDQNKAIMNLNKILDKYIYLSSRWK